mgnify:CR=1 FL=1
MGKMFHIVLCCPQIPNNTGNIGRTALATNCVLHIIHPIAFDMDEKALRRAGLDYWNELKVIEHESWDAFVRDESPNRLWLFTTKAEQLYWDVAYEQGDYLLFGSEQHGVSEKVHDWVESTFGTVARVKMPMHNEARSLNLATAVCAGVYEGLRQISK